MDIVSLGGLLVSEARNVGKEDHFDLTFYIGMALCNSLMYPPRSIVMCRIS